MMMPFVIGRPSSTRALEHALLKDKRIFLAAQHDGALRARADDGTESLDRDDCVTNQSLDGLFYMG